MAAQAGHDLTIEASRWSGDLTIGDDAAASALEVRIEMGALVVRAGTGGIKPLTDRDRREIGGTARKLLATDSNPEAVFTAAAFEPDGNGGGTVSGTFTLAGVARPIRLSVSPAGQDRYHVTGSVLQSDYGIKPYSGFLGALKVRDAVGIDADIDLSESAQAPA
jgi:polyisoprenoid-binding protein YceI